MPHYKFNIPNTAPINVASSVFMLGDSPHIQVAISASPPNADGSVVQLYHYFSPLDLEGKAREVSVPAIVDEWVKKLADAGIKIDTGNAGDFLYFFVNKAIDDAE